MPIMDAATRLSDGQVVTGSTVTSNNSYDTVGDGVASRAVGITRTVNLRLLVQVRDAFSGGTALTAYLVESDSPDLSSPVVVRTSSTFAVAALKAGAVILDIAMPSIRKRYVGIQYTPVGTFTTGSLLAAILDDTDSGDIYPAVSGF